MTRKRKNSLKINFFKISTIDFPLLKSCYTLIYYVNNISIFFMNKNRKFFIARTKRILKLSKSCSSVWMKLGEKIILNKKAQNTRQGGGNGSFWATRRFCKVGSKLAQYYSLRKGIHSVAIKHLFSRLKKGVSVFFKKLQKNNKFSITKINRFIRPKEKRKKKRYIARMWIKPYHRDRKWQNKRRKKVCRQLWNMGQLRRRLKNRIIFKYLFINRKRKLRIFKVRRSYKRRKRMFRRHFIKLSYSDFKHKQYYNVVLKENLTKKLKKSKFGNMLSYIFLLNMFLFSLILIFFFKKLTIFSLFMLVELFWIIMGSLFVLLAFYLSQISFLFISVSLICLSTIELIINLIYIIKNYYK